MRYRAIAWDIDGTLANSEALHQRALTETSAAFGVDLSDLTDQAFRGVHMLDVWDIIQPRMQGLVLRGAWLDAIERYYIEHRAEITEMPEAAATIRTLAARRTPQVCVSNSGRAIVDANLEALGVARDIAFSVCFDDVAAGKPDPEPFRQACLRLGLAPETVVAVEDSVTGAKSARAAGLYVVGYSPEGERFGPCNQWVRRLSEVARLFPKS